MQDFRINGKIVPVEFDLIKVHGSDAKNYLNGQATNDVASLVDFSSNLNCLVDLTGKVESIFNIFQFNSDSFLIIVDPHYTKQTLDRLRKFVVIDDVEIELIDLPKKIITGSYTIQKAMNEEKESVIPFRVYGDEYAVILNENLAPSLEVASLEDWKNYITLCGFQRLSSYDGKLITNSILSSEAVSLKKGCYLGQEVVSKILNNRGNAFYNMYSITENSNLNIEKNIGRLLNTVKLESNYFYLLEVKRDFAVNGKVIEGNYKIYNFPYLDNSNEAKAKECYEIALDLYTKGNKIAEAIELLEVCLSLNPDNEDAYEILAVLVGRNGDNKKAIKILERLVKLNPDLIMAHTNLSYFYMQDGKVEKAEEEKAIAIGLQMNQGPIVDLNVKIEEQLRREKMFLDVLEIDSEDPMALNGLAEIYMERGSYQKAKQNLEKVIEVNNKYSVAYLNLSKCLLSLNQKEAARTTLNAGIEIAAKLGEMKPANEMQEILNSL